MKKLLVALIALLLMPGAASAEPKLKIVATDFPCYDFARHVVGDRGEVTMLIHPGAEVHSFEPSPADILSIGQADLFVYIGGEGDAWVGNILAGFDDGAPSQLRMMEVVEPLEEEGEGPSHALEHETPEYDEHIWTSPKNAIRMVGALAEVLEEIDPEGEAYYADRAGEYCAEIGDIDAAFEAVVRGGLRRELVFADRFPFLYFARAYDLGYAAAFPSCTADTEPTPQIIATLIRKIVQDRIPAVYTIEMSTQSVAKTIAEETGVRILTLHSAQTVTQEEFDAGETYVTLMRRNVEALREGLN